MKSIKLPIRLLCAIICSMLAFSVFINVFSANVSAGVIVSNQTLEAAAPDYGEKIIVVSLGDSYSSGEGNEGFYGFNKSNMAQTVQNEDWLAHRSEEAWAGKLKISGLINVSGELSELKYHRYEKYGFNYSINWYFAASSGAVTANINRSTEDDSKQKKPYNRRDGSYPYEGTAYLPGQLDIFYDTPGLDRYEVDYVTITIGGNDVGFADIVETAINPFSTVLFDTIDNELNSFYLQGRTHDKIKSAYKRIEEAAPNATIIVAGYPELFSYYGSWLGFVSRAEADYINKAVHEFNARINLIVQECRNEGMKIEFVDVEDYFKDHQAYTLQPYINRVYLKARDQDLDQTKLSSYSMHPNEEGQKKYAEAVQAKIDELEGKKAQQSQFTRETSDVRNVVLVLDNSGSMDGTPLTETKKAAEKFIDTVLDEDAGVGIVSFSTYANIESDFSKNATHLKSVVDNIYAENMTNTYAGLTLAEQLLGSATSSKKIIVLMSDGLANEGLTGNALINYADNIKKQGITIYTLGFFDDLEYYEKIEAQQSMNDIASPGYHYEVSNAEDLVFFFNDIADQINGQNYVYIRIECPVDVTVTSNGETLNSKTDQTRTSFGTLTFEEGESSYGRYSDSRTKILRLREDRDYKIMINGNGNGTMDVKVGFMDSEGNYSIQREINDVPITSYTYAEMNATRKEQTVLKLDKNGDGKFDLIYRDGEPENDSSIWIWIVIATTAIAFVCVFVIIIKQYIKKTYPAAAANKSNRIKKKDIAFCQQCGNKITGECKFCTNCGARIKK